MKLTNRREGRVVGAGVRAGFAVGVLLVSVLASAVSTNATAASVEPCTPRVLVLTAMPLELNPLVSRATLDPSQTVRVNDRSFYVGRLAGTDVVLAMTGIGLVNAEQTATTAFEHFRCGFRGVIFSGVAGSRANIGDVAIPRRWTQDNGLTWTSVDGQMLQTAQSLQGTGVVPLARDVPVGDAACLCPGVDAATPVRMPQPLKVIVGGDGMSYDTYGGKALPCVPGGGDVTGCAPCLLGSGIAADAAAFASNAPSMADPAFFQAFLQPPAATTADRDAQDEETAPVARVARRYGVPFLGIRAVSDGKGDPLNLPGFPFQFFVYRQLAGNNAAAVTIAFLERWRPVSAQ